VDAVARVTDEAVHIDQSRDRVAAAPRYDPDLVDQDYQGRLYAHYGRAPYWSAGYTYPGYPYLP
jgi:hypothetical protein